MVSHAVLWHFFIKPSFAAPRSLFGQCGSDSMVWLPRSYEGVFVYAGLDKELLMVQFGRTFFQIGRHPDQLVIESRRWGKRRDVAEAPGSFAKICGLGA